MLDIELLTHLPYETQQCTKLHIVVTQGLGFMDNTTENDALRLLRERRGKTQGEFAALLNNRLGRKYDRARVSRWETGAERMPADVAGLVTLWQLSFNSAGGGSTISVSNQKGGCGKTEVSSALAHVLASAGARVLLVDADLQANATMHVGIDMDECARLTEAGRTLYHGLTKQTPVKDIVRATTVPRLDMIPSSIALAVADTELAGSMTHMRDMLSGVKSDYDFILIDCAPSLGVITVNSLAASDLVLIPVQTERYSIVGLGYLYSTIRNVRAHANPALEVLGVVPTMFNSRQTQDRLSLDDIHAASVAYGFRVFEPVPRSTIIAQACAADRITLDADPGAPGLSSYVEIARSLGVVSHGP